MESWTAVILFVLVEALPQQTDYCSSSICPWAGPHIACNGLTSLAPRCGPGAAEVVINSTHQQMIVNMHNELRSTVAQGQQILQIGVFYPPAKRMATMRWEDELARIASANTRRCVYGHDTCRNTKRYIAAGQNIAEKSYYGMEFSDAELMAEFINDWYSEFAVAKLSYIADYPDNYVGPKMGHFTQIIADRAITIGCAMVRFNEDPWTTAYFVCNYAITNIIGQPVYQAGATCSECRSGCSLRYPGLCNVGEDIDPNPLA